MEYLVNLDLSSEELLENKFQEKFYGCINGAAFIKHSSKSVFDKYFENIFADSDSLYVLSGADSALIFSYLREKFAFDRGGRQFIVVDFDSILALQKEKVPGWIVPVTVECFVEKIEQDFKLYTMTDKVKLVKSLATYEAEHGSPYYQLHEALLNEFKRVEMSQRQLHEIRKFINGSILNIYRNQFQITKLSQTFQDRSFLVVGAGPSLDDNLDWIKENQDRFIIIIVGRVSKVFLQAGISVDFVVSVDPSPFSFENSREAVLLEEPAILINTTYAATQLLAAWPQESVYLSNAIPWVKESGAVAEASPTVTHIAAQCAYLLGAKTVFLVGADFCFRDGQTHESTSIEVDVGKNAFEHLMHVKTYAGNFAETELIFNTSVEALQAQVESYHGCQFFNLNQHAAVVQGIEYVDKNELMLEVFDKQTLLSEARLKITPTQEEKLAFYQAMMKQVQSFRQTLLQVKKQSSEINRELKKNNEPNQKIARLNKKIDQLISGIIKEFLFFYGQSEFAALTIKDSAYARKLEKVDIIRTYSEGLLSVVSELLPFIDESILRLKLRLNENDERNTLQLLQESWNKFGETGRHRVWLKHHNKKLSAEDKVLFEQMEQAFLAQFKQDAEQYKVHLESVKSSTALMEQRLLKAFKAKDSQALMQFIEESEVINSDDKLIQSMELLAKGRVAEVAENYELAISCYNQVQSVRFREEALKPVLMIEMKQNNHSGVVNCFTLLCEISPRYMVPYAEYLIRGGQDQVALQLFELYLATMGDDYQAWLKYLDALVLLDLKDKAALVYKQLVQMFGSTAELAEYEFKV